jgi:hypothetical protein
VTVVDTDAGHVAAIRAYGLRIRRPDGRGEAQTVRAAGPGDADGPLGAVILAVKAQATGDAVDWIAPRLAADGYVASLQNGLCEPVIADRVGAGRTVIAFVNLFADLAGRRGAGRHRRPACPYARGRPPRVGPGRRASERGRAPVVQARVQRRSGGQRDR